MSDPPHVPSQQNPLITKWTFNRKLRAQIIWTCLGLFLAWILVQVLVFDKGGKPAGRMDYLLFWVFIASVPLAYLISLRRVRIPMDPEAIAQFEAGETEDIENYGSRDERRGAWASEMKRKYGTWGAAWRIGAYIIVLFFVVILVKECVGKFVR